MLIETDKKILGEKIRKYRKLKRLTQSQLAELVDLNEKQIYRIESGLNYPTYLTFAKLLNILEIDANAFALNNNNEENPLTFEILNIIQNADNYELKTYLDVLTALKTNLKNIKK